MTQAETIPEGDRLVIVEIGGNDLLGGMEAVKFGLQLDTLLAKIRGKGARVVLFELPLPPFQDGFGRAQRVLARKHGAVLIPKRILSRVFAMAGGTIDGLHLSPQGHSALAKSVRDRIVFGEGAAPKR